MVYLALYIDDNKYNLLNTNLQQSQIKCLNPVFDEMRFINRYDSHSSLTIDNSNEKRLNKLSFLSFTLSFKYGRSVN